METKPTKNDLRSEGQSKRRIVSRTDQGRWKTKDARRSAFEILEVAAVDRIPHLLELKYEIMAQSPISYFRGAAPVMAHDLGPQPHAGIFNQICGDAHLRNLGAYAGIDGRLVFDINDFDETVRGPFEWDVKRLATSIHLSGRDVGQTEQQCRDAVRVFLRRYRKSIHLFAMMPVLELGHYQVHRQSELAAVAEVFSKAERSTPIHLRDKLTQPANDATSDKSGSRKSSNNKSKSESPATHRIFKSAPPQLVRLSDEEAAAVQDCVPIYVQTIEPERRHLLGRYRAVDFGFKVVGTGSIGLRDYCIYFEGNGPDDPLFLQIKQEVDSVWTGYLPEEARALNHPKPNGERVVDGQRAMQVQSDPFLGYTSISGRDYLVRQLNDHKGSVNLGALDADALCHYADLCGELLARGHARSGDPDALAGYIGNGPRFDKAIADFAKRYADQTEHDWKELQRLRQS